jgi:hypothetical protein
MRVGGIRSEMPQQITSNQADQDPDFLEKSGSKRRGD